MKYSKLVYLFDTINVVYAPHTCIHNNWERAHCHIPERITE